MPAHGPGRPRERPPATGGYDTVVGLGYHCESTYQIRRFTGVDSAHYFDWLDLELGSVVDLVDRDFREVLRPGAVVPFSEGRCALDRDTGVRHFHDFRPSAVRDGRPELTQADIDAQLDSVREKSTALAERWRALARSPARVLYVHHDAFDESGAADLARLHRVLTPSAPGPGRDLLWLRRTPPPDAGELPPGVDWGTVAAAPGRWEGDDAEWDRALTAAGVTPGVPLS